MLTFIIILIVVFRDIYWLNGGTGELQQLRMDSQQVSKHLQLSNLIPLFFIVMMKYPGGIMTYKDI